MMFVGKLMFRMVPIFSNVIVAEMMGGDGDDGDDDNGS